MAVLPCAARVFGLCLLFVAMAPAVFAADEEPKPDGFERLEARVDEVVANADNRAELEAGEILVVENETEAAEEGLQGNKLSLMILDRPVDAVWETVTASEETPEFMPRIETAEVYLREGKRVGVHWTADAPLFKTLDYHAIEVRDRERGVILWELDTEREHNIEHAAGAWLMRPFKEAEDRTLVVYTVAFDTGKLIPNALERMLLNKSYDDVMENLRKRVLSDGEWEK